MSPRRIKSEPPSSLPWDAEESTLKVSAVPVAEGSPDPVPAPPSSEPAVLVVNGKDYPLVRIGLAELTEFLQWVKKRLPDPLEAISRHMPLFSREMQEIMLKDALARFYKPVTMGSPEYMEAFLTDEGLKEIVWYSVQRAGHDLTREQVDQAVSALQEKGIEEVGHLFNTVAPFPVTGVMN